MPYPQIDVDSITPTQEPDEPLSVAVIWWVRPLLPLLWAKGFSPPFKIRYPEY